jgi:asparagine synthase (glutamine-hydrolysing)
MTAAQVHRGPDQQGSFCFELLGAGLASCRLSLIDLEHGRQPVASEDGSVLAVLNGEIYNHGELRQSLASRGHSFRTCCDTEVLVHLYEDLGEELLGRLHGMFALGVLDTRRGRLLLARDGPGMKPLYFSQTPKGFVFASEAKALFASGLVNPWPDPAAIDTYLAAGFVPAPMSMFRGVRKLGAGRALLVDQGGVREKTFWSLRYRDYSGAKRDEEYSEELGFILERAVRSHLAADVPVGAFLSGGWDSSLTATLAARAAPGKLKTFSVIFPDDPGMDESRFSRQAARELGTDHHEIEYRWHQLPEILPKLIRHLEEPCTTAPAGVVYQLASLAAGHVKAVISGEGADELFGGYEWVRFESPYLVRKLAPHWPFWVAGKCCPQPRLRRALRILGAREDRMADAEWRRCYTPEAKREMLKPECQCAGPDLGPILLPGDVLASCSDSLQRRLGVDFVSRLSEGILFMTDKVSMAHSLEVRMPYLDRTVVDFALGLPSRLKVRRGREKRVLAALARRHLPPEIAARRKHGLGYPRQAWTSEPVAAYARQLLLDAGGGPFRRSYLERALPALLRPGRRFHGLASLVFLQSWWNEFVGRAQAPPPCA